MYYGNTTSGIWPFPVKVLLALADSIALMVPPSQNTAYDSLFITVLLVMVRRGLSLSSPAIAAA